MNKIIYIAGYGRSGSTLLDIVLSQSKNLESVGAFSNFAEWKIHNNTCACGNSVDSCIVWGKIIEGFEKEFGSNSLANYEKIRKIFESRLSFWKNLFLIKKRKNDHDLYIKYTKTLFSLVFKHFNTSIILDSSKNSTDSAFRLYNLAEFSGLDVKMIHLVRDPRGCMFSVMNGKGSPERKRIKLPKFVWGLRAMNGWLQANMYANYCKLKIVPDSRITIKYEDFVSNPIECINNISNMIGQDLGDVIDVIENGKGIYPGHNLGGNRLRFASKITIEADERWKVGLNVFYRNLFVAPCFFLARKFGYSMRKYEK